MNSKIYEIIAQGKHLHKYRVYHKGVLQGWMTGESPEKLCEMFAWKIEDCEFVPEAFSFWEYSNAEPVKSK
mgnify:CR=1 FL=1